jgi:hypothetical protein
MSYLQRFAKVAEQKRAALVKRSKPRAYKEDDECEYTEVVLGTNAASK